jgi:hypothetical protein
MLAGSQRTAHQPGHLGCFDSKTLAMSQHPGMMPPVEPIPPEALLDDFPPPMQAIAHRLRRIVKAAMPDAIERVRPGWRLIGYDLPIGRRAVYFAYVAPEIAHVHLGFEWGVLMDDPRGLLQGEGITTQVRWLTFEDAAAIDDTVCTDLTREAARVALLRRQLRRSAGGLGG